MKSESCSPSNRFQDVRPETGLIGPHYDIHPARDPSCRLIFLCDHASNYIPEPYQGLGLTSDQLQRHIAYDLGASGVTQVLADHFGATAVLSRFSRLLIDPNRGEDDPTLVMRIADGAVVPGNRVLDEAERRARRDTFYRPYHDAITTSIDAYCQRNLTPVIISLHSFTEAWKGVARPWQFGILWDKDSRIATPLLESLRQESDLIVGDNEPYSGELTGDTMWRHGTGRGLPHALIEVRQDLIMDPAGQKMWGQRLARALEQTLARFEAEHEAAHAAE